MKYEWQLEFSNKKNQPLGLALLLIHIKQPIIHPILVFCYRQL